VNTQKKPQNPLIFCRKIRKQNSLQNVIIYENTTTSCVFSDNIDANVQKTGEKECQSPLGPGAGNKFKKIAHT
jgi:hypothetical protein